MSDLVLDVKGIKCPQPIIKLSQAMKTLKVGQTIEVHATDPVFKPDIEAWTSRFGHKIKEFKQANGYVVAIIQKMKD